MHDKIDIKILSANKAWQGRKYKTSAYKAFEKLLMYKLKPLELPKPPFEIVFYFGFSNDACDYDNAIKQTQDILQKYYKFNDNKIYKSTQYKYVVPVGQEFIKFEIKHFDKKDLPRM